jgi:hypothetical protein
MEVDQDPVTLPSIFEDVIADVLAQSAAGERRVAVIASRALRRLFSARDGAVTVICQSNADPAGEGAVSRGARPAESLAPHEIDRILQALAPRDEPYLVEGLRLSSGSTDGAWALHIADSQGDSRVTVVVERPFDDERREFFDKYLQGQMQLHYVITALRSVQDLVRWGERVDGILSNDRQSLASRMSQAGRLLQDLATCRTVPEHLELTRRLATWAVQEQLGTGWGVRRLDGQQARNSLTALATGVREILRAHRTVAAEPRAAEIEEVSELATVFAAETLITEDKWNEALQPPSTAMPEQGARNLALFRIWSLLHERARAFATREVDESEQTLTTQEVEWDEKASGQISAIATFLSSPSAPADSQYTAAVVLDRDADQVLFPTMWEAAEVRNWLCLWLCHTLIVRFCDDESVRNASVESDRWRFRADLAYVIRESLRFHLYRRRVDYRYQPAAYTAALRTLVEQHSLWIAKVPLALDVKSLLREIGEVRPPEGYHFATGHLKHVLEIYIAGHFLCSIRIDDANDPKHDWTLGQVLLASGEEPPGGLLVEQLLQRFSIAALFHDIGMILFPSLGEAPKKLGRGDQALCDVLGEAHDSMKTTGIALVDRCVKELGEHVLKGPSWDRWILRQRRTGQPDHALLGAWYLHRISAEMGEGARGVMAEAARAILLHGAVCERIDVEKEPAAALLVLCDEVFEWEPTSRAAPGPNAVGRSLHAMAVDLQPLPTRMARFGIAGLKVRVMDGKLQATIRDSRQPAGRTPPHKALRARVRPLPAIFVELEHPEFLDLPTYRILLTMAQNLGRLSASPAGWAPHVHLTARRHEQVPTTYRLLKLFARESTLSVRPAIDGWLRERTALSQWIWTSEEGWESVLLGPLKGLLFSDDIRSEMKQIDAEIEKLMRNKET